MDNNLLGEQIAKYRKAAGLTQDELGRAVGISAQAVSRWECGGAPDITLLPDIAKHLNVTIDALFGQEKNENTDVADAVGRFLRTFPNKERMNRFCRLIWSSIKHFLPDGYDLPDMGYPESCRQEVFKDVLMYNKVRYGGGILLDVHAEDMSFVTLWPEPKTGYGAWLAPKDEYRRLFALLSKPGCLELLENLCGRKVRYYVPEVVAEQCGLPIEDVLALLNELVENNILRAMELELTEGEIKAYQLTDPLTFVPFLYMARAFMQPKMNYLLLYDDDEPLFRSEMREEKKQNEKEQ